MPELSDLFSWRPRVASHHPGPVTSHLAISFVRLCKVTGVHKQTTNDSRTEGREYIRYVIADILTDVCENLTGNFC